MAERVPEIEQLALALLKPVVRDDHRLHFQRIGDNIFPRPPPERVRCQRLETLEELAAFDDGMLHHFR